mmetsp:Transcript_48426/g.114342  ORF Transcript_48426/g.114342 Transcript_48426/m.114342 type:complete len:680 (+) Transcript_48426:155-2194(+)
MSYSQYGTGAYGYEEGGAASSYGQDYQQAGTGDTGGYTSYYGTESAGVDFSSDSYMQGLQGGDAVAPPLDLQMDSAPVSYGYEEEQGGGAPLETFQIPNFDQPEQLDGGEAPPAPGLDVPEHDSVTKLANQFTGSTSLSSSITSPPASGSKSKWADPMQKNKHPPADGSSPAPADMKSPVHIDPDAIDTTSANVSDVRKMWQSAAKGAPPPMPKTAAGGVMLPAAEASSSVSTVGLFDRSVFGRGGAAPRFSGKKAEDGSMIPHHEDDGPSAGGFGGFESAPDQPKSGGGDDDSGSRGISFGGGGGFNAGQSASQRSLESEQVQINEVEKKVEEEKPAATPTQSKPPAPQASPPSVDFSMDQFSELMTQIDGGDADQKAYAAMELQTMALDSRSQVLMAQNGAIQPLVKLLAPGDPMVQASAAGALWNLAANEQNKFAIAQAGAIQPLVAMLYSDVREAQLSAAGALQNLCVNASNKKTVAAAGGVEALMMLLSDKDRHVKAKAAGALQSLAVDEENQKKIKSLGAIPLITKLLSSRTPEVQSNAAGALHNLAVNDEEAQEAVATAGAIPPLISLMQNASPDLQAKAAATVWSIAGREENRKRIMEAGGIPPLVKMIQSNHLDCQSKASGAIRCLTMSAFTRPEFEKAGAIPHLVVLLSSGHQEVTINAAGALENLGCR